MDSIEFGDFTANFGGALGKMQVCWSILLHVGPPFAYNEMLRAISLLTLLAAVANSPKLAEIRIPKWSGHTPLGTTPKTG